MYLLPTSVFPGSIAGVLLKALSENSVVGPRASVFPPDKDGDLSGIASATTEAGDVGFIVDAGCHAHARVGMQFGTDALDSCLRKRKHGTPLAARSQIEFSDRAQ